MKKNHFLLMIVFSLMLTSNIAFADQAVPVQESVNPAFIAHSAVQAQSIDLLGKGEGATGQLPDTIDFSYIEHPPSTLILDTYVPYYDLRTQGKVTSVKDQGSCGACWTFASYASLESTLMPAEDLDLSEQNLKNLHGFDVGPCSGGNAQMAAAYLARWAGPVLESADPYDPSNSTSPSPRAAKHVQEVILLPTRRSSLDNDAIKWAIQQYGAVYASMIWSDPSYNSKNYSYYYTGSSTSGGHGVTIVGWDDGFDSKRFSPAAPGNGAFIIKNSWGDSWGEDGYFYISYYDSCFAKRNVNAVFTAEQVNNYDNIYQYDPLGWTASVGYGDTVAWGANVYTATSDEVLKAVSFYTTSSGVSYDVYIYTDIVSDPIGNLKSKVSGNFAYPGYHTVTLKDHVGLTKGQKFSVVIRLTTSGYGYPLAMEVPLPYLYSSSATANARESYIGENGQVWEDITTVFPNANLCIKALTSDAVPMPVLNTNTGKTYFNISDAVQDPLTLQGHTILVGPGTFQDNIWVNKELTIRSATGDPDDTVVKALDPSRHVFYVTASNVSISGFNVTGSLNNKGIYLDGVKGCSAYNNVVTNNNYGVYVHSSIDVNVTDNNVTANNVGILLYVSDNCYVSDNKIDANEGAGVYLLSASACVVNNNTLDSNLQGLRLDDSVDNYLTANNISSSNYGILLLSSYPLDATSDNTINTIVNGPNAAELELFTDITVGPHLRLLGADRIAPRLAHGNVLDGNVIRSNRYGILSKCSNYNDIINNTLYSNDQGIYFSDCYLNTVQNNTLDSNLLQAIYMLSSDDNNVNNNMVRQNNVGIRLQSGNRNILDNNSIISNSYGLLLHSATGSIISDNNLSSNNQGIYLVNCTSSRILNNTASLNVYQGVYIVSSHDNLVKDNQLVQNKAGIRLESSNNNVLDENIVRSNSYGFLLQSADDNIISNNVVSSNIHGIYFIDGSFNVITANTANDNTLQGLYLIDSHNNIIEHNKVLQSKQGIRLQSSDQNILDSNHLQSSFYGTLLLFSDNNSILMNTATENEIGICLSFSDTNLLVGNEALNSTNSGIYFDSSSYNDLISNMVAWNKHGMRLHKSRYNVLEENRLVHNKYGYLAQSSDNNLLKTNNVSLNEWYGMYLQSSGSNLVYNNMFNNTKNVVDDRTNTWNIIKTKGTNIAEGPYIGGNVWASPNGTGFSQTASDVNRDGICDKPYNVAGSSFDYLPLYFR
ncbi:NosD domain-containing protein [Methanomethylovorans sp.]|uniref:NosD domain-containing protein n=1 Tax=Methanomethylovorans sp. TaxID=2758717 RepID=UPI00345E38B2